MERDSGAALVLALGFMLAVGLISAGLAGLVASSLTNRGTLEVLRDREYAADRAIEMAISQVRALPVATCTEAIGSPPVVVPGEIPIRVDWATTCPSSVKTSAGVVYPQRNVSFLACIDVTALCTLATAVIRAQVNLEPATGPVTRTFVQSWNVIR
jgi:hypothetical protein